VSSDRKGKRGGRKLIRMIYITLQTRECRARVYACDTHFGGIPLVSNAEDTQAVVMNGCGWVWEEKRSLWGMARWRREAGGVAVFGSGGSQPTT
jgi:hypothetical protein